MRSKLIWIYLKVRTNSIIIDKDLLDLTSILTSVNDKIHIPAEMNQEELNNYVNRS